MSFSESESVEESTRLSEHPAERESRDRARLPTRVSKACERCRRHKSRCDAFRPCTICQRANVECLSSLAAAGPEQKRKRKISEATSARQDKKAALNSTQNARESGVSQLQYHVHDIVEVPDQSIQSRPVIEDGPVTVQTPAASISHYSYREAESIVGFARKIFQLSSQNLDNLATSALPDGGISGATSAGSQVVPNRLPVDSVLGCELPPVNEMKMLLEDYFESVHWFSLVIYEPTFRVQFESVCDGFAVPAQKPFLFLLSTVLALAAWYCSKRTSPILGENATHWGAWASKLVSHVENHVFDVMDGNTLANLHTCMLLGSYNSYHGKPKAALALLGATIKTAQAMGLHRESPRKSVEESEEIRRTWWTIYTWDRWSSTTYGRPLGINDKDCNVLMPGDVFENRRFVHSNPELEDDSICYSTYQRELNKLYLIASPVIEGVFGIRSSINVADQRAGNQHTVLMKKINRKLNEWRRSLPKHLLFDLDQDIIPEAPTSVKSYRLQALALQLTFDHLLIIFYRPILTQQVLGLSQRGNLGASLSPTQSSPAQADDQINDAGEVYINQEWPSAEQWWAAAIRTSKVTQLPHVAQLATDGHLVAFLGINLFHSAVVLVVCAMSRPLSDRAQEAKRNITLISRLQEVLGKYSKLSMQSSLVLRNMIMMIVEREAEAMLVSIEPPGYPNSQDISGQATGDSQFFSVQNALRLPLSLPADRSSHPRVDNPNRAAFQQISDESALLNESIASLQRIFPGNDLSANQDGREMHLPLATHGYDQAANIEPLNNSSEQFNLNPALQASFSFSGSGDDLYWIWNSIDDSSNWTQ